jgi:acyl transferase domain-containing protein/NAD(P)-dependent dehydrogenase (short-subunit alcohol dehydrogenase family)/acyl carrier protein
MQKDQIERWLIEEIARRVRINVSDIDVSQPMSDLGLSSEQTLAMAAALEDLMDRGLGVELLYTHPTIAALSKALAEGDQVPVRSFEVGDPIEPIAIVGIGCRFPGSGVGPKAYWDFLVAGGDAVSEVPVERWNADDYYNSDPDMRGKACTRWGSFVDDIEQFDAAAFGISPKEAAQIDPQQRMLLEASWHAIEDAGLSQAKLIGTRTGVFIGISGSEYARGRFDNLSALDGFSPSGIALSIAANRISYFFDLQGPSLAVDTACSSSLMAVHLACQSLRNHEVSLALAGGANVLLSPDLSIAFSQAGLMSPDGRCKAFDESADGYVRGEGAAVVTLKRLSDAIADNDEIYALILGSASVQDGKSNGLLAPRGSAQEQVIAEACAAAGISPGEIEYVEAHGTGTSVGDVIEASALGAVVGRRSEGRSPCLIGSVKSNIGHLESAAGIAGLVKVALCLRHEAIPASLHVTAPNKQIDFDRLGLQINSVLRTWPKADLRRVAGVSSFGFGGSNVHAVLGEHLHKSPSLLSEAPQVLGLSAHDPASLKSLAQSYLLQLKGSEPRDQHSLIYSAGTRSGQAARWAAVGRSDEITSALEHWILDGANPVMASRRPKLGFVFTGQGAIWPGVGRDLFEQDETFRKAMLECDTALREQLGTSILPVLFGEQSDQLLSQTKWAQPALFCLQYAICEVLRSWNVTPVAVVGHSAGEVAAAVCSGRLPMKLAAELIVRRGRAMQDQHGLGRMALILTSREEVEAGIKDRSVTIAGVNSASSVIIAGPTVALETTVEDFAQKGTATRFLPVDYAFHSAGMEEASVQLEQAMPDMANAPERAAFYASTRGRRLGQDESLDSKYWRDNVRQPVWFSDALGAMIDDGCNAVVEIGPHPGLLRDIGAIMSDRELAGQVVGTLRREYDGNLAMRQTAAELYAVGGIERLSAVNGNGRRALSAPPLPWEGRTRCWIERASSQLVGGAGFVGKPFVAADDLDRTIWQGQIDLAKFPQLADHIVLGETVVPAAAYVDILLSAAADLYPGQGVTLTQVRFPRMLILDESKPIEIQVTARKGGGGTTGLSVYAARGAHDWQVVAEAGVSARTQNDTIESEQINVESISTRCFDRYPGGLFYDVLRRKGLQYGPAFRQLDDVQARRGEALGHFRKTERLGNGSHVIKPELLDGSFHVLAAAFGAKELMSDSAAFFLPDGIAEISVLIPDASISWAHCQIDKNGDAGSAGNIRLLDETGVTAVEIQRFSVRGSRTEVAREQALARAGTSWCHQVAWVVKPSLQQLDEAPGSALILCDEGGLGAALAAAWSASGVACTLVHAGNEFARRDEEFTIMPGSVDDLRRVFEAAPVGGWSNIFSFWSLDEADFTTACKLGPANLAALIQALESSRSIGRQRLAIVTRGATSAAERIAANPLGAMIWGMAQAAVFEHPNIDLCRIDLDPQIESGAEAELNLLRRVFETEEVEASTALRGDDIYVARLRLASLAGSPEHRIRRDGTYLVTGGSGALAQHVVQALQERGAGTIVLASRSFEPWCLESDAQGTIIKTRCDVTDPDDVVELFKRLATLPPLCGVVHAAGVLEDGALLGLDEPTLLRVLQPKVVGAQNLVRSLEGLEPEFVIFFSSAASVLGSPGQASYSAANAYLDALAVAQNGAGKPVQSVSWGAWLGEGMAKERQEDMVSSGLIQLIQPQVGTDLMLRMAGQPMPHLAVLPFSVRSLVQFYPGNADLSYFSELVPNAASIRSEGHQGVVKSRPNIDVSYVAPRNEVEIAVVGMWERALGMTGIGIHDDLFALGGDSVFASQILAQVNQVYAIRVDPEQAFDAFTVERLAEGIAEELMRRIESMDDADIESLLGGGMAEDAPVAVAKSASVR